MANNNRSQLNNCYGWLSTRNRYTDKFLVLCHSKSVLTSDQLTLLLAKSANEERIIYIVAFLLTVHDEARIGRFFDVLNQYFSVDEKAKLDIKKESAISHEEDVVQRSWSTKALVHYSPNLNPPTILFILDGLANGSILYAELDTSLNVVATAVPPNSRLFVNHDNIVINFWFIGEPPSLVLGAPNLNLTI